MQFKEVLAAGKDDYFQLGIGSRVDEYSRRKFEQPKDNFFGQMSAEQLSGCETHSLTVPDELDLNYGLTKVEKRAALNEMVQIASGQQHTMILKKNGSLYSWGLGMSGQLGFSYEEIQQSELIVAK